MAEKRLNDDNVIVGIPDVLQKTFFVIIKIVVNEERDVGRVGNFVDAYVEGGSVNPIAPSIEHYTATILNTAYNTDKYKAGCTTEGVRGFTTGQFASGEVAYALNNGNNIWKQTLDGEAKDSTPTLNTSKSVKVKCSCSFTFKTSWRFA